MRAGAFVDFITASVLSKWRIVMGLINSTDHIISFSVASRTSASLASLSHHADKSTLYIYRGYE